MVWFGQNSEAEFNTVSESLTKVGIELLGQLKKVQEAKKGNLAWATMNTLPEADDGHIAGVKTLPTLSHTNTHTCQREDKIASLAATFCFLVSFPNVRRP